MTMATWTHEHHKMSIEECKKDRFCEDNHLNCYKSDMTKQPKDSSSAAQTVSEDFAGREDITSQPLMSRKQMEEALEQILADIKSKRENDIKILSDVKREVMAQAARSCDMLEQYMNNMHQLKSKELDAQIMTLMNALNKSQKVESELEYSKTSLSLLCQDIKISAKFM